MTSSVPGEAVKAYAALPVEQLVVIAYLDDDYLPEARELARTELDKRGLPADRQELIARVRHEQEQRKVDAESADRATPRRAEQVHERIALVVLVLLVWGAALVVPINWDGDRYEIGSMDMVLCAAWIFSVMMAIRKFRRGKSLMLYAVLVVPAFLFMIGVLWRLNGS